MMARRKTTSPKTKGPTAARITSSHPRFGQQLTRNGVVFERSLVKPPADLDELLQDLNRERESKSPSESEYRSYLEAVDTSYNEDTLTRAFDSLAKNRGSRVPISKDKRRSRYIRAYNIQFTQTAAPTQKGISNPKPDIMEGLTTVAYPADALSRLSGALAPTKHPPAMPAFIVHAKGPGGLMDEAEKQCAYGEALPHVNNTVQLIFDRRLRLCPLCVGGTQIPWAVARRLP
jgi:hypothetical protein